MLGSGAQSGEYCYGGNKWRRFSSVTGDWIIQQAFENQNVDFRWKAVCSDQEPVSSYLVHLEPRVLEQAANRVCGMDESKVELPHQINFRDPLMFELVASLKKETLNGNPFGRLYIETLTQFFAVHVLKNCCSYKYNIPSYENSLKPTRLSRVIEFLHENYSENLSLDDLARIANLSTYHFARASRKTIGKSPHQY